MLFYYKKRTITAIGLILLIGLGIYFLGPGGLTVEKVRFVITADKTSKNLPNRLKKERFIRSEKIFTLVSFLFFRGKKIEPGAYQLSHGMNVFQLTDTLVNHPYQKWVTFIPGLRKEQVAEILAEKFNWKESDTDDFLTLAEEGFMYPDTYLLNVDYSPQDMMLRLKSNFNDKFDVKLQQDLLAQDVRNDTAIKIASLIERESGGQSDKALIAGIIWNRLTKKMKLDIDATVQYALGKPEDWWPKITSEDYKFDSPYNTYKISGLPPGPIANPGLDSIKAAIYPAETNCLYYLHDNNKQIHCAVNYKEHLANIEKYLR